MTFADFNFPIYIFLHLFLHQNYGHISLYAFNEESTPTEDLYAVHTCRHTHNKYASNNLSEFHRFLPEDLTFEILR